MDFENEKRDFINEYLLTIEDVTEDILEKMKKDEGIIITMENGRIIDVDAVWSEDDEHEDCWDVKIYENYEEYIKCEHYDVDDSVRMKDFTINHIKRYMK